MKRIFCAMLAVCLLALLAMPAGAAERNTAFSDQAEIRFDETAQTPWFTYTGSDGQVHEVWFEDPRSCLAKFRLPAEYGLHGLGVWNFMRPFTAAFSLMNYLFRLGESVDN